MPAQYISEIFITNWTDMGNTVPVPRYSVDIEIKWLDEDNVEHTHSSTRFFPNELAGIPIRRLKRYMEMLIIQEVKIKLGIDEDIP